jgi:hypothetical protein
MVSNQKCSSPKAEGTGELTGIGTRENFGVMEMFYILICMVITKWVHLSSLLQLYA